MNLLERVARIVRQAKQISTDAEELVNQCLELGGHVSLGSGAT